jgi:hypothetical protein
MNSENQHNLVYSKNILEFVTVAAEYCLLIESPGKYKTADLVNVTRKLLAFLYLKTSMLPEIQPKMEEELEKYVSELDYNVILDKWLQKMGGYDLYHEVFDPEIQFGTETVTASISEGLLDIYQDLKECLTSYSLGDEEIMNDALAECLDHFRDFWGQRLVNVLRALHQLWVIGFEWEVERNQ